MLRSRKQRRAAHDAYPTYELTDWTSRAGAATARAQGVSGVPPPAASFWSLGRVWRCVLRRIARAQRYVRVEARRRFAEHGRWISLHQTSTLLLCNLVIASLFYPAVVMYLLLTTDDTSAAGRSPACVERQKLHTGMPSVCVSGAFASSNIWELTRASLADLLGQSAPFHRDTDTFPVDDLRMIWDESPSLEVVAPPDAPDAHTVPSTRVAQLLVTTQRIQQGDGSPYGVLQPHALLAALEVQQRLVRELRAPANATQPACIRRFGTDECLVLSPLDFWHGSAEEVLADWHPAKSYTGSPMRAVVTPPVAPAATNTSLPLLYSTTLTSRWPYLPLLSRAEFLVLTFFLEDRGEEGAAAWARMVDAAAARVEAANVTVPQAVRTGETYLRFRPQSATRRPRLHFSVVVFGYMALLVYIFRGLLQMRRLHSRFGIAFTGTVQLIVDMIMSLSLCALLGIRLTAVPWAVLPFIIVLVGSDTMLFMIRTITSTPLHLTVPARIAYGLAQVAEPITLTTLSDMVLVAIFGSAVPAHAVRQFCLFTVCTLLTDYFMQMTFFVTILSIDMQRLELAEVLVQGGPAAGAHALGPAQRRDAKRARPGDAPRNRPRSALGYLVLLVRRLWRTRSAHSMSFTLFFSALAAIMVYYASSYGWPGVADSSAPPPAADTVLVPPAATAAGPYGVFWDAVNRGHSPYVRVLLEPWRVVSFAGLGVRATAAHFPPGPWFETLFLHRRQATLFTILLFVVMPILTSMLVLSSLLRYLLKGANLLEVRDYKSGRGSDAQLDRLLDGVPDVPFSGAAADLRVTAHTAALPLAPIVLLRVDTEGVSLCVDASNTLRLERLATEGPPTLRALDAVRNAAGAAADATRVTCLDFDWRARIAVTGQQSGRVAVLGLERWGLLLDAAHDSAGARLAPTQHVQLLPEEGGRLRALLTQHRDGAVFVWTFDTEQGEGAADRELHWATATLDDAGGACYAHQLAAPPPPSPGAAASAWTHIPLDTESLEHGTPWLCMVSSGAQLRLGHLRHVDATAAASAPQRAAAEAYALDTVCHLQAPRAAAPMRCAALFVLPRSTDAAAAPPAAVAPADANGASPAGATGCAAGAVFSPHTAPTPPPPPQPVLQRSPRHSAPPTPEFPWLLTGDINGHVHLFYTRSGAAAAASLALDRPVADGAVTSLRHLSVSASLAVFLSQTRNRAWFVGVVTGAPMQRRSSDAATTPMARPRSSSDTACTPPRLVLLGSVENRRGCADVFSWGPVEARCRFLVGVRRATTACAGPDGADAPDTGGDRWEVWRMHVPAFSPVSLTPSVTAPDGTEHSPEIECVALHLEQLIWRGVGDRAVRHDALALDRLPLVSSRISQLVRAESRTGAPSCRWLFPYGNVLLELRACDEAGG